MLFFSKGGKRRFSEKKRIPGERFRVEGAENNFVSVMSSLKFFG